MINTLLDFATLWSLFLTLGYLLNSICNRRYRYRLGVRVFSPLSPLAKQKISIQKLSHSFIHNTIFRYFGNNPFTWTALFRSTALSVIFFFAILSAFLVQNRSFAMAVFLSFSGQNVYWIVLSAFSIMLMDWFSFVQTYYFMKYASNLTFGHIVFIAYADIILSVNIFLFVFPLYVITTTLGHMLEPYEDNIAYAFAETSDDFEIRNKDDQFLEKYGYLDELRDSSDYATGWEFLARVSPQFLARLSPQNAEIGDPQLPFSSPKTVSDPSDPLMLGTRREDLSDGKFNDLGSAGSIYKFNIDKRDFSIKLGASFDMDDWKKRWNEFSLRLSESDAMSLHSHHYANFRTRGVSPDKVADLFSAYLLRSGKASMAEPLFVKLPQGLYASKATATWFPSPKTSLFFIHVNRKYRPEFVFRDVFDVAYSLYAVGFRVAQLVQLFLPELLWNPLFVPPLGGNVLGGSDTTDLILHATSGRQLNSRADDVTENYLSMCDGQVRRSKNPILKGCEHGFVLDFRNDMDVDSTHAEIERTIGVPIGIFFLTSFCCTLVFYFSLFVFIFAFLLVKFFLRMIPASISTIVDLRAIRNNSVWILISIGGLPIAALVAITRAVHWVS